MYLFICLINIYVPLHTDGNQESEGTRSITIEQNVTGRNTNEKDCSINTQRARNLPNGTLSQKFQLSQIRLHVSIIPLFLTLVRFLRIIWVLSIVCAGNLT